jgi:hypothetical protein
MSFPAAGGLTGMNENGHPYMPGDPVVALHVRGGDRYWLPGVVRSVGPTGATVDLGRTRSRRIPYSRLRLGAVR